MQKDEATALLRSMTETESLLLHAETVACVMEAYANKFNQDPQRWYATGLLHDADYEKFPEKHPDLIVAKLRERNEDEMAYAISAHYTKWGRPADSTLDKALLACDELTGFIVACARVRPGGLTGLTAKSVRKKLKQKSFAAKVDREEIQAGVELLGEDINEHIDFIIRALQECEQVPAVLKRGE